MNTGLVTARIIKKPIRFFNFNHYVTELHIIFLQMRNYFAHAIALADGEIGKSIFDIYREGDYLILEGEYLCLEDSEQNIGLILYITEVNPACLIMQK